MAASRLIVKVHNLLLYFTLLFPPQEVGNRTYRNINPQSYLPKRKKNQQPVECKAACFEELKIVALEMSAFHQSNRNVFSVRSKLGDRCHERSS